jgi:hypothetical protein
MNLKSLVKQAVDQVKTKLGIGPAPKPEGGANSVAQLLKDAYSEKSPFYSVTAEDWYKTFPYRFKIVVKGKPTYYSLPIPPEALSYQMVSASQLIPTLGGVVEETSPTVFWQIALSGTTGIGISRSYSDKSKSSNNTSKPDDNGPPDTFDKPASGENSFRTVLKGGLLANTFNKVVNATDAVMGAWGQGAEGAFGLLEGLASTAQRYNTSAVKNYIPEESPGSKLASAVGLDFSRFGSQKPNATNGYVEIHLLHNFLNSYSHLKENDPDNVSLYFESQKDNMQWQVIVKNFGFQKNAAQPYLYKYNIVLQGFDLSQVGGGPRTPVDRFGADGDLGSVSSFTLSGASERAQSLTRKISTNPLGLIASKPPII